MSSAKRVERGLAAVPPPIDTDVMSSIPCRLLPFLAALLVTAAPGIRAQSADIIKATVGEYLVAPTDGTAGCRIRLERGRTIGGMVAVPAKDCATQFRKLEDVTSWSFVDRGLSLNDATRKSVMVFQEDETAIYKTRNETGPNYILATPKPGVDRAPFPPAIVGTWTMQRPGGPSICTVTFRDKPPAGSEENFALDLDAKCDATLKRLKLTSWAVEDFSLLLYGKDGDALAFEPSARGFEKAEREKGKPLWLVRAR